MNTTKAAGFFWLITFLTGLLSLMIYRGIIVGGNAAATATNILEREASYRAGVAANLVATATYIAATILVYALLKPVNRNASLIAAFFSLTACAVSGLAFVFQLAPLVVLRGTFTSEFTPEQVQTIARLCLRLGEQANSIAFVFFGLHVLVLGALLLRASFASRIVGALMTFGGIGWLTFALANLLSPSLGRLLSPWILLPGMIGEGSLIVWLLTARMEPA